MEGKGKNTDGGAMTKGGGVQNGGAKGEVGVEERVEATMEKLVSSVRGRGEEGGTKRKRSNRERLSPRGVSECLDGQ